jgi:formylglycine-generating enzyme required for sulfatase activity/energy-coupling factor transporter ATP-binding protein EcfA2
MAGKVTILHLSDLHFGMEPTEKIPSTAVDQRNLTLEELTNTLATLDEKWRPDLVAVSGDIGWKGIKADYDQALSWFRDHLLPSIKLAPQAVVVCPGNHDIDRTKTLGMKPPDAANEADEWLKLEHIEHFSRPFEAFVSFCEDFGLSLLEIGDQSGYLTGKTEKNGLCFVVINSAWFCRGDSDRDKLWLGKPLLEKMTANKQLVNPDNIDEDESIITLALFHHPHEWLNEHDYNTFGSRKNTLEYLTKRSHIVLNGHVHARPAEPSRWSNQAWVVKGGAAYAEYSYQNHFSILRICTASRTFERLTYEFDPGQNQWRTCGDEKKPPAYDLKKTIVSSSAPHLIIPGKYKQWISAQCKDMDISKLSGRSTVILVSLPEIYIPLFTNPIDRIDKKEEKQEPVDIENLIAQGRTLVIEGRAGSGKTTLVKHFAHMMIQSPEWKGLAAYLPVLVFLKDLKGFNSTGLKGNSDTGEKMLAYWSKVSESFLDLKTIRAFCKTGKVIFFLDGLDEIDESLRELVVSAFHSIKIKHENCKIILSGRPHGVDEAVKKWFGDRHIEILPLLMSQVEAFIHKWFQFVYENEHHGEVKTAQDLIGEIKAHSAIDELIDSPLMLTAICLLYNDDKELPGQRAELYDRFVSNLLYKRFHGEAQKVRNFLMDLAKQIHEKREKNISRVEAVAILGDEYKKAKEETNKEYKTRLNTKFDVIEPACGLLKFEQGGYGFIHLTFQEFLTANALVAEETGSYFDTIQRYWDDDWYREVVQLYIGYLSIQSQGMGNGIIRKVIANNENKPFARSLLAARSFVGIQRDSRDDSVVRSIIKSLWKIIESEAKPLVRAEAGELLGRLGDDRDLGVFIQIPDGTFTTSAGQVTLKSFEMAKYPVSNQWFKQFIQEGGYRKPELWSKQGKEWLESEKVEYPRYWYDHRWNCDNHPVVGVCWYEADAFCKWRTRKNGDGYVYHLPTEQQWEAAATGKKRRDYPWGKGFDKNKCNTYESGIKKTSAVGIFKDGDTIAGLSDMSGNVWEWTSINYDSKAIQIDFNFDELITLRGGSWGFVRDYARCGIRFNYLPFVRFNVIGFRCSRTKN